MAEIVEITLGKKIGSRVQTTKSGNKCTVATYETEIAGVPEVVDVWDWKNETEEGQVWKVELRKNDLYNDSAFLKERIDAPSETEEETQYEPHDETDLQLKITAAELAIKTIAAADPSPGIPTILKKHYDFFLKLLKGA